MPLCDPTKCYNVSVTIKRRRKPEKDLYEPIKKFLCSEFDARYGNCYLERTDRRNPSEKVKEAIPKDKDIIMAALPNKKPDLMGFYNDCGDKKLITVEIKLGAIKLEDVYQAKLYGDLFSAKYALLISTVQVPQLIKRLHKALHIFNLSRGERTIYIGQWQGKPHNEVIKDSWCPDSPF